jgi:hypothetical protein
MLYSGGCPHREVGHIAHPFPFGDGEASTKLPNELYRWESGATRRFCWPEVCDS